MTGVYSPSDAASSPAAFSTPPRFDNLCDALRREIHVDETVAVLATSCNSAILAGSVMIATPSNIAPPLWPRSVDDSWRYSAHRRAVLTGCISQEISGRAIDQSSIISAILGACKRRKNS